nr:trimeric intracellular cation channel family protein [uncultured Carboxylicivirga sp.]
MDPIVLFDYIGTMVFAISGTLTAAQKRLDLFGAMFIGFVTAIGGGTVRDIMLGNLPVTWIKNYDYFLIILLGIILTVVFKKTVIKLKNTLFLFDTIGIGVFTVLGIEKTLELGISQPIAVIMGLISAVVGGIIRDTLCNELPLIFHREIYATACIAGSIVYLALRNIGFPPLAYTWITVGTIITIRLIAVKYSLAIPLLTISDDQSSSNPK